MKQYEDLRVEIYKTRVQMGEAAAKAAADLLRKELEEKDEISCIFAAAPSQNEFLASLLRQSGIDWSRVNACHMDEYMGLPVSSPGSFSGFLDEAIFTKLPFQHVYRINGAADPTEECKRYTELLKRLEPEFVFMGIGENGHIAFNDPPVADFEDPYIIKPVELDQRCREQQVHDGCFQNLDDVPTHALTVTIPALMHCKYVLCIVPGLLKASAVKESLQGPVSTDCPASILRHKENAVMYLDDDSASLLEKEEKKNE